jgi:hypothetical protein
MTLHHVTVRSTAYSLPHCEPKLCCERGRHAPMVRAIRCDPNSNDARSLFFESKETEVSMGNSIDSRYVRLAALVLGVSFECIRCAAGVRAGSATRERHCGVRPGLPDRPARHEPRSRMTAEHTTPAERFGVGGVRYPVSTALREAELLVCDLPSAEEDGRRRGVAVHAGLQGARSRPTKEPKGPLEGATQSGCLRDTPPTYVRSADRPFAISGASRRTRSFRGLSAAVPRGPSFEGIEALECRHARTRLPSLSTPQSSYRRGLPGVISLAAGRRDSRGGFKRAPRRALGLPALAGF